MTDPRIGPLLVRLGGLYRDPARVERDASSLLRSSVGEHLRPEIASLVENNGDTAQTLCLKGTIAIFFRSNTYQQLLDIYFPSGYPVRPPKCFVRLAPNMYIKEGHAHVAQDGQVYLPYLHEWRPHSHNMIELVVAMSSVFSADPPVFSRPTAAKATATTTSEPPPPAYNSSMASSRSSRNSSQTEQALAREAAEANRAAETARRAEQQEERQRAQQEEWDAKVFGETKSKVKRKLQKYLQDYSKTTKESLQADMQDQVRLQQSKDKLKEQMVLMETLQDDLTTSLKQIETSTVQVQEWLADYESSQQENGDKPPNPETIADSLVQPVSALHQQMMDMAAENNALTDALYFLDKGLHQDTLTLTEHLKQVRRLAKRQFLVRAHLIKISQTLMLKTKR